MYIYIYIYKDSRLACFPWCMCKHISIFPCMRIDPPLPVAQRGQQACSQPQFSP